MSHLKSRLQYLIQYTWEDWGILNRLQVFNFAVERGPDGQTQAALGICSSANPSLSQLDATIQLDAPSCCSCSCYSVGVTLKMLLVYLEVWKSKEAKAGKPQACGHQRATASANPRACQGKARHVLRHCQVSTKPVTPVVKAKIVFIGFQSGRDDGEFSTSSCNICFWSIQPKQDQKSCAKQQKH